ncbi:MAG: cell division protein FtsL [Rhodobacter sp.]|nr:cell division protein FtsL [Rhodobacter sp.]MCY4167754.1 cell division protein FtsL [Rhodobacter sp.]MCY4241483.1 cell division protein FtsL [Rhodobacter sp.]
MRPVLCLVSVLGVIGFAFWAYQENYRTRAALGRLEDLQREVGSLMEVRAVLRAEWAYLNRPDRLRELADLNFEELGLFPLFPEQFGYVEQIAFPPSRHHETAASTDRIRLGPGSGQDRP